MKPYRLMGLVGVAIALLACQPAATSTPESRASSVTPAPGSPLRLTNHVC